jgi:hypothetical protein
VAVDADLDSAADPVPDAGAIAGMLADEDRRRVVAALVLGSASVDEICRATGLPARDVLEALTRLVAGELVVRGDDGDHVLLGEAFRRAAVASAPDRPAPDPTGDAPEDEARVLRTHFRAGRLTGIPAQRSKRRVVLDRLAQEFEVGVRYNERAVNGLLRPFHPDVAALRRYLVDEGFLDREPGGEYWRAGGTVGPDRSAARRPVEDPRRDLAGDEAGGAGKEVVGHRHRLDGDVGP